MAGPYHADPPAARIAPSAGSTDRSWIGQPSHNGPRSDHDVREASPSRMKAPFDVPTSSRFRVMAYVPRLERDGLRFDVRPQDTSATATRAVVRPTACRTRYVRLLDCRHSSGPSPREHDSEHER